MEFVIETTEIQPKFMGQVPCAPLKSLCEAGAPQAFLYVSIPSTFSSLIAQAARKIFLECKPHHVTFYEPLPWLHTAV